MNIGAGYDTYLSFINCQLAPAKTSKRKSAGPTSYRAVTLSRQTGSGAHAIAAKLAERLQAADKSGGRPWTVFDRELVTKVLEDHHLPARMAEFIPEDRMSELQGAVQELFGLRPAAWTLIQHISETILRLVELGNVILIGRAANVITRSREDVLHVRLAGSVEKRVARLQEMRGLSRRAALAALRTEDRGRERYLKKYFGASIYDPLLYHVAFNTDLLSQDRVADLLCEMVLSKPEPS